MKIRTQLVLSSAIAVLVGLAVIAALVQATRQAQRGLDEQSRSQTIVRQVANMLALTNELAVYGGDRVATQWHLRQTALMSAIDEAIRGDQTAEPTLLELKRNVEDLPPLFDKLVEISRQPATELSKRRRELLMERLLAETQEVIESRHRWSLVIGEGQQRNHRFYSAIVLAAPAALLLLLLSLGLLISRRVLVPLRRLEAAAIAIQHGKLDVRCASTARDEFGDTARAVDAMTVALQESEKRLRLITDSLPAFISHLDTSERYTFVNAHFARTGAGDPASMIGRTHSEVHRPEDHLELTPRIARVLVGEHVAFEQSRLLDGRLQHVQTTLIPDVDASGAVRGFYALGFDITDRKEAELRLAANERLLVGVTDNLPALVAYIDQDGRYRFANSKYQQWLGADPKAMVDRSVKEAMGEEFYAAVKPHADLALAGQQVRWERSSTMQDGQERHLLIDYIPDIGDDAKVRGFFALTIDITELKDAQRAEARVGRQLRAIADNVPVMIGHVDWEERYTFINATGCRVLGIDEAAALGRRMSDVMSEEAYGQRREQLHAALAGERAEFDLQASFGGQARHLQTVYIPDIESDGRIAGAYLLATDVTALKQSEQDLKQMAGFDSLTGLPNRRHFEDRLKEAVARSTRERRPIALMFLDIDHFKRINDTWGHGTGDLVLKEFAVRLKNVVRATDMAARLAGDEFVLLLEGLHGEADVTVVAEKLVAAVRKPFYVPGAELMVTTSVGIAYSAWPRPSIDLMEFADQALYRAKAAGRNTFELSTMETYVSECGERTSPRAQVTVGNTRRSSMQPHALP